MNPFINYLTQLLELDYDFKIYTEDTNGSMKVIETKYGKYYATELNEMALFNALVHMRACLLNEVNKNGR